MVKVDPTSPTNMDGIVHEALLISGMRVIDNVVETLRLQLELNLIGSLVVHMHVQTSPLFPLSINWGNHEDDVSIGLL